MKRREFFALILYSGVHCIILVLCLSIGGKSDVVVEKPRRGVVVFVLVIRRDTRDR